MFWRLWGQSSGYWGSSSHAGMSAGADAPSSSQCWSSPWQSDWFGIPDSIHRFHSLNTEYVLDVLWPWIYRKTQDWWWTHIRKSDLFLVDLGVVWWKMLWWDLVWHVPTSNVASCVLNTKFKWEHTCIRCCRHGNAIVMVLCYSGESLWQWECQCE